MAGGPAGILVRRAELAGRTGALSGRVETRPVAGKEVPSRYRPPQRAMAAESSPSRPRRMPRLRFQVPYQRQSSPPPAAPRLGTACGGVEIHSVAYPNRCHVAALTGPRHWPIPVYRSRAAALSRAPRVPSQTAVNATRRRSIEHALAHAADCPMNATNTGAAPGSVAGTACRPRPGRYSGYSVSARVHRQSVRARPFNEERFELQA